MPAAAVKIKHVNFVWSKKERDARSPIYPQADALGHKLETLRLVSNFSNTRLISYVQ